MYWRRPVIDVWFEGTRATPAPMDLMVEQSYGENTIMSFSMHYPMDGQLTITPKVYKEDTFVKIRWGTTTETTTWYGYVHHSDYRSNSEIRTQNVQVDYVVIGNGHIMTNARTKDWREITDSGIAQEIATNHNLSLVAHKTKKIHTYVYQDRKSDLAFLHERAAASGRRAWVENGVLYFVDPAAWAAARAPQAPLFTLHKDGNEFYDITSFRSSVGGDLPFPTGRLIEHSAYGVDVDTGTMIYNKASTGDNPRPIVLGDTRLDSMADLENTLISAQVTTQDWLTAEATLEGSVKLQPGQPITLEGRALAKRLRGDWVVTNTRHRLAAPINNQSAQKGKTDFVTWVKLARNAPDTYIYTDRSAPRIPDDCVMGGDTWRAAQIRQVIL